MSYLHIFNIAGREKATMYNLGYVYCKDNYVLYANDIKELTVK